MYNHIRSSDELHTEIGYYAILELKKAQLTTIAGKERSEAIGSLADAIAWSTPIADCGAMLVGILLFVQCH